MTKFIEPDSPYGNTSIKIYINNIKCKVLNNVNSTAIIAIDNENTVIFSYAFNTLFKGYLETVLEECQAHIIKYYNCTEEETFQYSTVFDFSTFQAMVHIHDAVEEYAKERFLKDIDVIAVIQALINNTQSPTQHPNITYTLSLRT